MKSGSCLNGRLTTTTDDNHTILIITLALLPLTVTVPPCPWQLHLDPEPPGPHEATDTRGPISAASPYTTSQGIRTQSSQNFPEYQHPFHQHMCQRGKDFGSRCYIHSNTPISRDLLPARLRQPRVLELGGGELTSSDTGAGLVP